MKSMGVFLIMAATLLSGCQLNTSALKDGYEFGDLSRAYCASMNSVERGILRVSIEVMTGVEVDLDYCAGVQPLADGYDPGDITRVLCDGMNADVRADVMHGLGVSGEDQMLEYCEVADYVLEELE